MEFTDKLRVSLLKIWSFITYGYEWAVYKLLIYEDDDARKKKIKREFPESYFMGRLKIKWGKVMVQIDRRHTTNKEQRMFVEALLMGHRYRNPESLALVGFTERLDIRPITRERFKIALSRKTENKLSQSLEGLNILYPEYLAMIKVAEGHQKFQDTYNYILEDLQDRINRGKAFKQLMIFPASAFLSIVAMEVFVALYLIPEITVSLGTADFSRTPTLSSYITVREILLTRKMEFFLKSIPIIVGGFIFFRLRGTKFLVDMTIIQIPMLKSLITNWEISKFFNSLRGLLKSSFSVGETVDRSVDVITNRVIKMSLKRDIANNVGSSPHLYDIFKDSVHISPEIINQLKIAKDNKSDAIEVLDNVHEEFKDSMKDIMEKPADLVMPAFSGLLAIYIGVRLLPIYAEINLLAEMMSRG